MSEDVDGSPAGEAPSPIEIQTLTDGGQRPADVARGIAAFLSRARASLDLALYDVRFETDAGALVLAALLAAVQRGVQVRLLYNVAHPGPIAVPPPPETAPEAIESLPVETRGVAGIPDLMHHKFVVRDSDAVWGRIARAEKEHVVNAVCGHCSFSSILGVQQAATSAAGAQISG